MIKNKNHLIIISLFVILLLSIAIFSTIGSVNISVMETIKIIFSNIPLINKYVDISSIKQSSYNIIWKIRIPRVLLGVLVGASLSVSGTTFQGMFKNPMADPYIIGISSGAALGATIAIILNLNFKIFGISFLGIPILAFIGAMLSVYLVYNLARMNNKIPVNSLLLSGVAVSQFFTAIMSFSMVIFDKDMKNIIYWTMGGLAGKGWDPVVKLSFPIIIIILIIISYYKDLNLLLLGEESAHSMGVDVEKTKLQLIILSSFITAIVVSISGIIGFVGLIIPHTARLIFGPDHKILIPSSALIGGIFMILADTIARTIISPIEIPVGIITSLFGGPFFIYILKSRKQEI